MENSHRPTPAEIQMTMPSEVSFEDYYGLTQFPKLQSQPPPPSKPIENPVNSKNLSVEDPPSPPPSLQTISENTSTSPLKDREKEDWVTVKNRGKKKPQEGVSKFESLAEQQLNNNKTKKKSIKKKLKDIQDLLKKQSTGEKLDSNQIAKIQNKKNLEKELASLA
jgi:uncharacterized protein with WD repeat